jgi:sugar transferase (PEP-CTERM/EpsH1 system associated)
MLDAGPWQNTKPNLLFLCHRLPYPPDKGEKIRAFRILRHLARDFRVHLGCFIDDPEDVKHVEAVEALCASLMWLPMSPATVKLKALRGLITGSPLSVASFANATMGAWVAEKLATEKPVIVFVYSSAMAQFVLGRDLGDTKLVMDFVDVDSDKWRQYAEKARIPMKWVYTREARKLLAFDRRVAAQSDAAIFVSDAEADLFRTLSPETAGVTHAMANGIDCEYFAPAPGRSSSPATDGPHIVFTGTMDYWPNVDAVMWFTADILPLIRRERPQATFTIVGSKPTRDVLALGQESHITVTGRVPDVRPYLDGASVVVAPMRMARGIQNKVLEGMAMAKPVVTTQQGLEGIHAEAGRHLLVADTAEDFARAVIDATTPAHSKLGYYARRLMQQSYAWPARLALLDELLLPQGR